MPVGPEACTTHESLAADEEMRRLHCFPVPARQDFWGGGRGFEQSPSVVEQMLPSVWRIGLHLQSVLDALLLLFHLRAALLDLSLCLPTWQVR